MKNIIRRIIVGIIIGLVLMCCRKYLFLSANASTNFPSTMDTFRFTRSNGTFTQSGYNGQDSEISSSSIGDTNSGNLSYFFHLSNNVPISKGSILYFSVGTAVLRADNPPINSTFSTGTTGEIILNNKVFPCEVSSIITDFNTQRFLTSNNYAPLDGGSLGFFTYTDLVQDIRYVSSYKCFIDEDTLLQSGTNSNVLVGPNLSYYWGGYSFYSLGRSDIIVYNSLESLIIQSQQATTNAIEQTNDTLTDSTTDDPSSDLDNMSNKVATNGTISQLLTLPIQLYQNILNNVSGSCSSFNLGNLLGTNILLPCINLEKLLGSTLYGIIDILCSGLFILAFRKKMVDIFNHMTSLNDRGNELE